jgi:hypothetical protein
LRNPPTDTTQLIAAMAAEGLIPVYEGKHIEQFIHGEHIAPIGGKTPPHMTNKRVVPLQKG